MRLELHLFLWVTAGSAVLLQIYGGVWRIELVSSKNTTMRAQLVSAESDVIEIGPAENAASDRIGAIKYDRSARPMFTIISSTTVLEQNYIVPEAIAPPILKGVLGGAGGRRAVFSREPGGSEVLTVSPGETVADYRIEQVGEDFVTAVSPAGEVVRFQLRGAGEGH